MKSSGFVTKRSQWSPDIIQWLSPLTIDGVPVHEQRFVHGQLWYAADGLFALVQPRAFIRAYGTITGSNSSLKGTIIAYHPAELFTNRVECSCSHLKMEAGGFAPIT